MAAPLRCHAHPRPQRSVLAARDRMRAARCARRAHPGQAARAAAIRVGALPVLSREVGSGGGVAGNPGDPRRSRRLPGGGQGRAARGAGRASTIWRLPGDRARRGGAHPRHERHHGTAHRVRRGGGRLDAHRRGARPHPVGRGHSPGRSRHDLLLLQPLHGLVGRPRRRGASGRDGVSLRGRGGGTDLWPR